MTYAEHARATLDALEHAGAALAFLRECAGKSVLLVSHDDPDGITSALLAARTVAALGGSPRVELPAGFVLRPEQLAEFLARGPAERLIVLDKGTFDFYDRLAEQVPDVLVIDHHPSAAVPRRATFLNPAIPVSIQSSTSSIVHLLQQVLGLRTPGDDLANLIGLTGDWAINMASGHIAPWAAAFVSEVGPRHAAIMTRERLRATMFDGQDRQHSCLLNQITEVCHAVGGGGFQYFYHDRDPELAGLDHPRLVYDQLAALAERAPDPAALASLGAFFDLLPQGALMRRIYAYFVSDWDRYGSLLESAAHLGQAGDVALFLFVGQRVPLLPMLGSIKLFDLQQSLAAGRSLMIMLTHRGPGLHFSIRATSDALHSGDLCRELMLRLQAIGPPGKIGGGGHPRAAECLVETDAIPLSQALWVLLGILEELRDGRLERESLGKR